MPASLPCTLTKLVGFSYFNPCHNYKNKCTYEIKKQTYYEILILTPLDVIM